MRVNRYISFFAATILLFLPGFAHQVLAQEQSTRLDSGRIYIETNLDEFYLVINEDFLNAKKVVNKSLIALPVGEHTIRIAWTNINDWVERITVFPDFTTNTGVSFAQFLRNPNYSTYPTLSNQRNLVVFSEPETDIFVDDEFIGTGSATTFLPSGKYSVQLQHAPDNVQTKNVDLNFFEIHTVKSYFEFPPEKSSSFYLIPGAGYLHHRKHLKSLISYATMGYLGYKVTSESLMYSDAKNQFDVYETAYNNADNTIDAITYRELADEQIEIMRESRMSALLNFAGFTAIYALTSWDGYRIRKSGRYVTKVSTEYAFVPGNHQPLPQLTLTHSF